MNRAKKCCRANIKLHTNESAEESCLLIHPTTCEKECFGNFSAIQFVNKTTAVSPSESTHFCTVNIRFMYLAISGSNAVTFVLRLSGSSVIRNLKDIIILFDHRN